MSSDIDIEEHNPLDHPTIKTMFPDITAIKLEVDDEVLDCGSTSVQSVINYKEMLEYEEPLDFEPDNLHLIDTNSFHQVSGNKIILGTKPTVERNPYSARVLLKDWKYILKKHPYFCNECLILFPTQNTMDSHRMTAHSLLVVVDEEMYSPPRNKARKSTTKSIAFNVISRNKAVKSTARSTLEVYNKYSSRSSIESDFKAHRYMRCQICQCVYVSMKFFRKHTIRRHDTTSVQPINIKFDGKCIYPNCYFRNMKTKVYNHHILVVHGKSDITFKDQDVSMTQTVAVKGQYVIDKRHVDEQPQKGTVPKDILFKCNKCPLHFLAACVAWKHSAQCCNTVQENKCNQCGRGFKSIDVARHSLQHKVSSDFEVTVISKSVAQMVVCRCDSCGVLFDERTFLKVHASGCEKTRSVICEICNMRVDESFSAKHSNLHSTGREVITVNWVCPTKPATRKQKDAIYYCRRCKLYGHKRSNFHLTGRCQKLLKAKRKICKLCGLCFSYKSFHNHLTREHANKRLTLNDYEFYDIHNMYKIAPPLPVWKKCVKCKINFFGFVAWRKHKCFDDNFRQCSECNECFSDLAYKLHIPFHNYTPKVKSKSNVKVKAEKLEVINSPLDTDIQGILEKYESMQSLWNIIYMCDICEVVFDSYDNVVEHCQNHFCNMENYDVIVQFCFTCGLKFDQVSYERHAALHLNNIKKSSFKILKFNYENLLKESWFDIFKPISEEQKNHIIAKSLYVTERGLRLYLEKDGSSNNTLFKCGTCNSIIDESSIIEHAKKQDGCPQNQQKFKCSHCGLLFPNKPSLSNHQRFHNTDLTKKIIAFNLQKDFSLNKTLCSLPRKGNLKFNWCRDCGRLIKKDIYSKHILKHKNKRKLGYVVKNGIKKTSKRFEVYKCSGCSLSIFNQKITASHKCLPRAYYFECEYCHLILRKTTLNSHNTFHKRHPSFNRKNINVVPFARNVDLNELLILYQCQKCKNWMHNERSRNNHTCITSPGLVVKCRICKLSFTKWSFVYHQHAHKRLPNLTRKDFTLVSEEISRKRKFSETVDDKGKMNDSLSMCGLFLYKCTCDLLFVSRQNLIAHMEECETDRQVEKCANCDLIFHSGDLEEHLQLSNCDVTSYTVGKVVIRNTDTDCEEKWIFECSACRVSYTTEKGLKMHFVRGHMKSNIAYCGRCKTSYPKKSYNLHVERIHKKFKCTAETLNKASYTTMSTSMLTKVAVDKSKSTDQSKKVLYKCSECPLHFANIKTLMYHYDRGGHSIKRFACRYCGLHFTQILIRRHEETEHTLDDYIVRILPSSQISNMNDSVKTNSSIENISTSGVETSTPLPKAKARKTPKTYIEIPNSDEYTTEQRNIVRKLSKTPLELLRLIHQCTVCKANCLREDTMASHMNAKSHPSKLIECDQCGLSFTSKSIDKHKFVHHTVLKLNREDFFIRQYRSAKDFEETDDVKPSSSDQRVSSSDVTDNRVAIDDRSDAPKLYKCGHCDVYFTSYDLCCEHATDHIALDSTEYISCKVCDLQFVCECIGVHMRGHRENTFSIDNSVIIEFLPQSVGPPTTSSYPASERLKSIISTTTDCE